jgi:ornithine cyclodeaminase/alanine dehydrogenase-like protein (mu-crystallin family)
MRIIDDCSIASTVDYIQLFKLVENYVDDYAGAEVKLYPRCKLHLAESDLTLNYGESIKNKLFGYRVYADDKGRIKNTDHLTVVYSSDENKVKGIIIGEKIGAIKTALITTLAIKNIINRSIDRLGIIGSGIQAEHHIHSIVKILGTNVIYHYSKTKMHATQFAGRLRSCLDVEWVEAPSSWEVVKNCEVVITATNSDKALWTTELIPEQLRLICHIGSKYNGYSEIPGYYYQNTQNLYTDSLEQLMANAGKLAEIGKLSPQFKPIFNSDNLPRNDGYSIYLSQGISGLDVILSNWFLSMV